MSVGPVERAVRKTCRGRSEEPLVQVAYNLARKLDTDAGMATAAVSKELRATLAQLDADTPKKEKSAVDEIASRRAARRATGQVGT